MYSKSKEVQVDHLLLKKKGIASERRQWILEYGEEYDVFVPGKTAL